MFISPFYKKVFIISGIFLISLLFIAFATIYFFKDRIIQATINELNKYIVTKVEVKEKIELSLFSKFPEISVKFENVDVFESAIKNPQKLAHAGKLYLTFNFWNMLHSSYTINHLYFEDGFVRIKVGQGGEKNYEIIKQDTTSSKQEVGFNLEKIIFKNVNISYENTPNLQFHDILFKNAEAKLKLHKEIYHIEVESDIFVNAIKVGHDNFFSQKDVYVKSLLEYNGKSETFQIAASDVKVENAFFKVAGKIELKQKKYVDISLKENNASIQTLLSLLPESFYKEFKNYESTGEIYCNSKIKGFISNKEFPRVEVDFGFKNASIFHPALKKKIDKASFQGYYTNGSKHNASSSFLKLSNIHCAMDGKVFTGSFSLNNFKDPTLQCHAKGKIDAEVLSGFYKLPEINSISGIVEFNIQVDGRINDLQKKETAQRVRASGEISLLNMVLTTEYSPLQFTGINGELIFSNNDISISNLIAKIGKSDFHFDGYLKNFVSKVFFDKQSLYLEGELQSSFVDLDELFTRKVRTTANTDTSAINVRDNKKNNLEGYDLQLNCKIGRLKYELFDLRKFRGVINFNQPHIGFKDVEFDIIGGKINLDCYINANGDHYRSTIQTSVKELKIDSLFYIFKNFDQKFIVRENLKGELSGTFHSQITSTKNFTIDPASINVAMDAIITHGELVDFEPMKRLSKFIDEKKLERIQFSELRNKILIENEKIFIPEMEIKSNASDLFISGTHTFNSEMDYRIALPLKNFKNKKEDKDAAYGAIEEDNNGNANIFLTIKGTTEQYKIAYDKDRTKKKIGADLKKEKTELQNIFKRKKIQEEKVQEKQQEEFFDFDK